MTAGFRKSPFYFTTGNDTVERIESLGAQQRDGFRADTKHRSLLATGALDNTIMAGGSIFFKRSLNGIAANHNTVQ
jgi:hypothetical protein